MTAKQHESLFTIFRACYDSIGNFPLQNPVVNRHCQLLLKAIDFWLRRDGNLTISLERATITINQSSLENDQQKLDLVRWFKNLCNKRHISELLFLKNVNEGDLHQLFRILHKEDYLFSNHATAPQLLAIANVHRIQINSPTMEDSFTRQVPFSMGENFYLDRDGETEFHLPEQAVSPAIQANLVEDLFITQDDLDTLRTTMRHLVAKGALTRVADALTLMRNDLRSLDRGDRELAFSSYQVVINILIETGETRALYRIVKAMPFDLRICQEYDLYNIHLQTFACILKHFESQAKYRPLLYGLTVLAEQSLRHRDPFKSLLEDQLKSFLRPELLERLVKEAETEPDLRSRMNILFREHALGIFNTLLEVLFETKERRLRKVILETLHDMGEVIYPDVMNELDLAIKEHKPWYIKRNLLLLLSRQPPDSLLPQLIWLDQHETSKRVLALVYKCAYRIDSQEALTFGHELANRNLEESWLLEMMGYVGDGGLPAYAALLIDIAERHHLSSVRLAAISTLGQLLDSPVAVDYLKSIVNKTSFFKTRNSSKRRITAVRALAASNAPQHLTFLAKFVRDKDAKVRKVLEEVLELER